MQNATALTAAMNATGLQQRKLSVYDEDEKIGRIGNVTFYGPKGWVWIPITVYGFVFLFVILVIIGNA